MSAENDKETPAETPPAGGEAAAEKPAAEKPAKRKAVRKPTVKRSASKKAAQEKGDPDGVDAEKDDSEKAPPKKRAAKAPVSETAKPEKKPPPKRASARRRGGKDAQARPRRRVVHAHARYVRTSARKARMVTGHLRGRSVQEARAILAFAPRGVARDWSKLLESAVANAENNHELLEDDLFVREAYADEGPTIKRFRPRAMGRATPIRKRTSHLTITLTTDA